MFKIKEIKSKIVPGRKYRLLRTGSVYQIKSIDASKRWVTYNKIEPSNTSNYRTYMEEINRKLVTGEIVWID